MARLQDEIRQAATKMLARVEEQKQHDAIAAATLSRRKGDEDYTLTLEQQRVECFAKRMQAITPDLIVAMTTLGNTEFAAKLSTAIAPLALHEQQGLYATMDKVFANTPLAPIISNLQSKTAKA